MNIQYNIKYYREHHKLTLQTVADEIGVSIRTVQRWEAGIHLPEMHRIDDLCIALSITPNQLIRGRA